MLFSEVFNFLFEIVHKIATYGFFYFGIKVTESRKIAEIEGLLNKEIIEFEVML